MTVQLPIPRSIETPSIKGDLGVFDGVQWKRLPVGADGQYLQLQSGALNGLGMLWVALPGTTKGDIMIHTGAQFARFPRGVDGEILTTEDDDIGFNMTWRTIAQLLPLTTKGDLLLHTGAGLVRLAVGADGETIVADASAASGARWTGGVVRAIVAKSANYTLTEDDYTVVCDASGGSFNITLPAAASTIVGTIYNVALDSPGSVTVDTADAALIDGSSTMTLNMQNDSMTVQLKPDLDWKII